MTLHLLAIPHTVTRDDFSHCAFTGKVQRFAPMLRAEGFDVIHYGVAGATSGATENVDVLEQDEHRALLGIANYHENPQEFVGTHAKTDHAVYKQFNYYLRDELKARLVPGDIICLPFGPAHEAAVDALPIVASGDVTLVETGIGYPNPFCLNRVYESEAWRHWVLGKEQRDGQGWQSPRHEVVIPNYYNLDEWPERVAPLDATAATRVVFFGRIGESKGCGIIPMLARSFPDLTFVLCGQGDATPYLTEPNIEYHAPISGADRAAYLAHAALAIFPSRFVEPFCGAAVEAMLVGTPVLTSSFGAFTETVIEGTTGYRCDDEIDFVRKLPLALALRRSLVAFSARQRFDMYHVGARYAALFHKIGEKNARRRTAAQFSHR